MVLLSLVATQTMTVTAKCVALWNKIKYSRNTGWWDIK